ncbi:MAG: YueI family protein [Limosilactobacillus gorillae]|uniref:YueI family protein n=1 Tax=Limosilactobacillus gorillae TaxID=1450649 RepID=UPI000AA55DA2|nr:YueI family protein [Limosilactobacillus gorillae]MDO4854977.1 YueI family protein [Limosilactobacillus gorillae]
MDNQENNGLEQRLQNGIYGTPKINPDEQRRYLGTFRERVCLTISNAQIKERSWTEAVEQELKRGLATQVFINGNLPDELTHPYIQIITKAGGNFTLKTDPQFKTTPDRLALVMAANDAVYQSPVDVAKRYPDISATTSKQAPAKKSWWQKIFSKGGAD